MADPHSPLLSQSEQQSSNSEFDENERMRKKRTNLLWKVLNCVLDVVLCRGDLAQEKVDCRPVSIRQLFRFTTLSDVVCVFLGAFFASIGGAVQPFVLVLGGWITTCFLKDRQQIGNDEFLDDIRPYLISLGIGGVVALISTFLQAQLLHRGCCNMVRALRREYLAAVLRQDASWFGINNSGAITSQLNSNIQKIEDGLGDKLGMMLRGFAMFISSIVVCMYINWKLTLISVTMGPLSAWTLGLMGKVVYRPSVAMLDASTEAAIVVEESVMNVKTVAACNAQTHMVEKYSTVLKSIIPHALKYHFWVGFFEGLTFIEIYAIMGTTFWVGIYGYYHGFVTHAGDVLLIVNTISLTGYYLGLLGPHMMALLKARVAAAVIYKTIDRKPRSDPRSQEGMDLLNPRGDIHVNNVTFAYPNRDNLVLKGINWSAKSGESVALVGKSGCGKSTSIGLLTRLFDVGGGEVTIDGIPIERINVRFLRKMIGIVEQEPCLFNGTVMENIILGRKEVTEEDAKKAAVIAKANEFVEALRDGYNTILGVGGVALSGGQKQRIAIARAIAADPKILLLDEATSALDTESERVVQAALNRAAEGRTTVIIAHRLSTLKDVDRIYVVENGQVSEKGTHEELIEKGGVYAGLAKSQEISSSEEPDSNTALSPTSKKRSQISEKLIRKQSSESSEESKKSDKRRSTSGLLLLYSSLSGSDVWKFVAAVLLSFARGLEMPMLALQLFLTFEALKPANKDSYNERAAVVFGVCIACGLIVWIAQCLQYLMSGWTAESVVGHLRVRVLRSLLHRPMASFDRPGYSPAACVASISQHASNCQAAFDYHLVLNTGNFFSVCLGLSFAFVFAWQLALLGTGLCLFLFTLAILNIRVANSSRKRKEREDRSAEYSIEIVEQARTIQLLTVEEHFLKRYADQQAKSIGCDRRIGFVDAVNLALTQSFVFFCDLSMYALASHLIYSGAHSLSTVFIALMGSQISGWSVMYSAPYFPDMVRAASSAKLLFKMIDDDSEILETIEGGTRPGIRGDVLLEDVDFAYPNRKDVLVSQQLNIKARRGQSIALVGASGCGKSTIINLLERFYTADAGQVLIDGHCVEQMNLRHLRNQVALVSQEPVLFKGSILENITMGAGDVSMDRVVTAARTANAAKFIEAFPAGYDTDVGERGRFLSGGQKQRIAIARALVRDPKIILLDEATSALDTESEEIVQKALNDASVGRTSITIAHRLSSIQHCDKIYVIDRGSVVERGSHHELLRMNGRYTKLVEAQQLNT